MTVPCRRDCSDLGPGEACPACGHTSMAHPGVHNPMLDGCAICGLQLWRPVDMPRRFRWLRR